MRCYIKSLDNLAKYLDKYAESEVGSLDDMVIMGTYKHAIVIPAFNESSEKLIRTLQNLNENTNTVLIWVNNYPSSLKKPLAHNDYCELLQSWSDTTSQLELADNENHKPNKENKIWCFRKQNNAVIYLDTALDDKYGVGLARKIGVDLCCKLFKDNKIISPWILNTDADIFLTANIINFCADFHPTDNKFSCALLPYRHTKSGNNHIDHATQLYESSIRYYQSGLKYAGSPYAYQSLGSTILLNISYYCSARGFPKRAAGEDFYLLNKLNKLAPILQLSSPVIGIESRLSNRAPFGTGPAVAEILKLKQPWPDNFKSYHPEIFKKLKTLLQLSSKQLLSKSYCRETDAILKNIGYEKFITHANTQSLDSTQIQEHFFQWFDAFKTLKFIHGMRDQFYPDIAISKIHSLIIKEQQQLINEVYSRDDAQHFLKKNDGAGKNTDPFIEAVDQHSQTVSQLFESLPEPLNKHLTISPNASELLNKTTILFDEYFQGVV